MDARVSRLVAAAREVIESCYVPGKHQVGAAVETSSGEIFVGVNLGNECAKAGVCAEAVAIGAAASAGHARISCAVAVTESGDVIPPCGVCRELISEYGAEADVLLDQEGAIERIRVSDLLPARYRSADHPNRRET